jgi:hypothetical protein
MGENVNILLAQDVAVFVHKVSYPCSVHGPARLLVDFRDLFMPQMASTASSRYRHHY